MNDVKHHKTGRWSVEAFKQAVRKLTIPIGRLDALPGEDRLLAIFDLQLPLVGFDPLAAGAMDDKAAAAHADRPEEGDASRTAGQDTGKDSRSWAAATGHQPDHAAVQARRIAGHVPPPEAPAPPPGAITRDRTRSPAMDSDPAKTGAFANAPMPATATGGLPTESPQAIMTQPREHDPGPGNDAAADNAASHIRRGQPVDPLRPVARQLTVLADALLGQSGGADKTASGNVQPWPFQRRDDRGPIGLASDRQVPRAPGRLRQPPGDSLPADHRGRDRTDAPINQAAEPKKALGKTYHHGEASPKDCGAGHHHRFNKKMSGRRRIATIGLVRTLTDHCGPPVTADSPAAQPEGQAIQTGPLTDGRQTSATSPASEMPPARPAAHTAYPRPGLSALPPSDDHMPAERLADMINDVLISQARRHGVDLS